MWFQKLKQNSSNYRKKQNTVKNSDHDMVTTYVSQWHFFLFFLNHLKFAKTFIINSYYCSSYIFVKWFSSRNLSIWVETGFVRYFLNCIDGYRNLYWFQHWSNDNILDSKKKYFYTILSQFWIKMFTVTLNAIYLSILMTNTVIFYQSVRASMIFRH